MTHTDNAESRRFRPQTARQIVRSGRRIALDRPRGSSPRRSSARRSSARRIARPQRRSAPHAVDLIRAPEGTALACHTARRVAREIVTDPSRCPSRCLGRCLIPSLRR